MSEPIHKGKMTVWKDDRGFGFIEPENGSRNVFIHISALKKMPRRPVAGDMILYHLSADKQGKPKAVNAVIEGVEPFSNSRRGKKPGSGFKRLFFVMLIIFSVFLYRSISKNNNIFNEIAIIAEKVFKNIDIPEKIKNVGKPETDTPMYECLGKTRCSEMTSCEEATFYLRNCPGVEIDGDGDGIPCERQLCAW